MSKSLCLDVYRESGDSQGIASLCLIEENDDRVLDYFQIVNQKTLDDVEDKLQIVSIYRDCEYSPATDSFLWINFICKTDSICVNEYTKLKKKFSQG